MICSGVSEQRGLRKASVIGNKSHVLKSPTQSEICVEDQDLNVPLYLPCCDIRPIKNGNSKTANTSSISKPRRTIQSNALSQREKEH
jgi:hypothetical protein